MTTTITIDTLTALHRAQFLDGAASAADELAAVLDGLVGKTYTRRYDARMPEGVSFAYRTDYGVDYFEAWYTAPGTPNGDYIDAYFGRRGVATIVDHRTDSRVVGADLPAAVRASAECMRARAAEYRCIVEDPAGLREKAAAYNAAIDAVRTAYAGFTVADRDLLDIAYPDVARLRI